LKISSCASITRTLTNNPARVTGGGALLPKRGEVPTYTAG